VTESVSAFDPPTYDAVYASFRGDVPHVVEVMKQAGGKVLEVCCGNGRLLIPALEAGVEVDGLDLHEPMLDDLRRKLVGRPLSSHLFHADMRDFTVPDRYALILIAFNSFYHNLTQQDQLATLRRCRRHLAEGGRLAIVAFHPSAPIMIKFGAGEPVLTETARDDGILRVYDHAAQDRVEQISTITRRIEYLDRAGTITRAENASFQIRYVFKPEMELLLRVAGFTRWETRPLFTDYRDAASGVRGRPAAEGDHLLYTAWNEAP